MDANWFDALTTSVSRSGTRRGLVAALPLAGVVGVLLGEEATQGKRKRKKACAKAGQIPNNGKRKGCCKGLTRDANGRCAAPDPSPDPVSCTGPGSVDPGSTQGLQEAIDGAEAGATLTLCAGTWNLTSTVQIAKNLTLIGAGADATILDGGNAVRVLYMEEGTVTLQDLTIRNGHLSPGNGGGIFNKNGTLRLQTGSRVTGNSAPFGAGIFNEGTVTLQTGSRVTGNIASTTGGGIYNEGTVTLQTGSSVTVNTARFGGGIFNLSTLTLQTGSRVTGNTTTDNNGGGISNYSGGTVTLDSGAMICSNMPLDKQCDGTFTGTGACPAPSQTCPS